MFSWKKDSASISDKEPVFHVRYIGAADTFTPNGAGCTTGPLQKLWDNAPHERHLRKVAIQISLNGIFMTEMDKKTGDRSDKFFNIENISFCAADKTLNERLFCWISKQPNSGLLQAHAVLCSSKDKAETIAAVLSRVFYLAYKDWKADRQREERRKSACMKGLPADDPVKTTWRAGSNGKCENKLSASDQTSSDEQSDKTVVHIETVAQPD